MKLLYEKESSEIQVGTYVYVILEIELNKNKPNFIITKCVLQPVTNTHKAQNIFNTSFIINIIICNSKKWFLQNHVPISTPKTKP